MRSIGVAGLALMLASPLAAQERLVFTPPGGFTFAFEGEDGALREWLPEGESLETWTRLVTHTHRPGLQVTAMQFAQALAGAMAERCAGLEATLELQGLQNGYDILVITTACPLHFMGGKGAETTIVKVIAGREAIHTVQYAWRGEMDDSGMVAAMRWTVAQILCDPSETASPCP